MRNKFVKLHLDLYCEWKKVPPIYRLYVNHEMFSERTYIWGGTQYLREILQLAAPPGRYIIRLDNLGDPDCQFKIRGLTTELGPASVIDSKTFEITNESA
jgi:hypothetical protein